jgi:hypothetical protein
MLRGSKECLAEPDDENDSKRNGECTNESGDWSSRADEQKVLAYECPDLS